MTKQNKAAMKAAIGLFLFRVLMTAIGIVCWWWLCDITDTFLALSFALGGWIALWWS